MKFFLGAFTVSSLLLFEAGAASAAVRDDSTKAKYPFVPGYNVFQDSTFARAMRLGTTGRSLFFRFSRTPSLLEDADPVSAYFARMRKLPDSTFIPTEQELYAHQLRTFGALSPPYPRPFSPGTGISIPLSFFGQLLGLIQDVSPTLHYTLGEPSLVQVNVYRPDGEFLVTALADIQSPGDHLFVWDGFLSGGRRVPHGDYILELTIGITQLRTKFVQM